MKKKIVDGMEVPWYLHIIHTTLKDSVIKTLQLVVNRIPKKHRIDCKNKLQSSELLRQWIAFERGLERYNAEKGSTLSFGGKGRSNEAITLIATLYFSILEKDANWQRIVTLIIDSYIKGRK